MVVGVVVIVDFLTCNKGQMWIIAGGIVTQT